MTDKVEHAFDCECSQCYEDAEIEDIAHTDAAIDAEIHTEIAKRVYPDAAIKIAHPSPLRAHSKIYVCAVNKRIFNLLETDSNGNPTQQAKASALDVLCWMILKSEREACILHVANFVVDRPPMRQAQHINEYMAASTLNKNPCEAIYEVAKEIVKATQQ